MLLSSPRNAPKEIIHSRAGSSEKTRGQILTGLHQFGPHVLSPATEEREEFTELCGLLCSLLPVPPHRTAASRSHSWCGSCGSSWCLNGRKIIGDVLLAVHWEDFSLQRSHWDRFADDPLVLEGERCVTDATDVMEFVLACDSVQCSCAAGHDLSAFLTEHLMPLFASAGLSHPTCCSWCENWGLKSSGMSKRGNHSWLDSVISRHPNYCMSRSCGAAAKKELFTNPKDDSKPPSMISWRLERALDPHCSTGTPGSVALPQHCLSHSQLKLWKRRICAQLRLWKGGISAQGSRTCATNCIRGPGFLREHA